MHRLAILTPDPIEAEYALHWPPVRDRLCAALAATGADVVTTPWTEHADDARGLEDFDLILPLIVWSYHKVPRRWLDACAVWRVASLPLANPASVLIWNTDKTYLRQLAQAGVPIAQTLWPDLMTEADVEAAHQSLGSDILILKPRISGGAFQTLKHRRGDPIKDLPTGPAMIQPYLPTIASEGELSLLYFGGRFSHAVRKTAVKGDFRIQTQYGGTYRAETPSAEALALADQALAQVTDPLLYARVDMVRDEDGRWLLMELELIEPDFYLGEDPAKGALFAQAVQQRLAS